MLTYEQKVAEVLSIELNTPNAVKMIKEAIEMAEMHYACRDGINLEGENGVIKQIQGGLKFFGTLGATYFFKKIKATIRLPSIETISQDNYFQILYDILNGSGELNFDSLKGILLRSLFCNSGNLEGGYMTNFKEKYNKEEVNLTDLYMHVMQNLSKKIKPKENVGKVYGPQTWLINKT